MAQPEVWSVVPGPPRGWARQTSFLLPTLASPVYCVPSTEPEEESPFPVLPHQSRMTKGRGPRLGTGGLLGDCRLTRGLATHSVLFKVSKSLYLQTLRDWLRDRLFISLPLAALGQGRLHLSHPRLALFPLWVGSLLLTDICSAQVRGGRFERLSLGPVSMLQSTLSLQHPI